MLSACSPRSRNEIRKAETALLPVSEKDLATYITVGLTRWLKEMGDLEIKTWKHQLRSYPDAVLKDAWNAFQREYRYPNRPNVAELVDRCEERMGRLRRRHDDAWSIARQEADGGAGERTEADKARVAAIMDDWRQKRPEEAPKANPMDRPRHVLPLDGPEREEALERLGR